MPVDAGHFAAMAGCYLFCVAVLLWWWKMVRQEDEPSLWDQIVLGFYLVWLTIGIILLSVWRIGGVWLDWFPGFDD